MQAASSQTSATFRPGTQVPDRAGRGLDPAQDAATTNVPLTGTDTDNGGFTMHPRQMAFLIHEDRKHRIEQEWQELLRRPDAPPLPPEEPTVGLGTRLSAAVRAFIDPLLLERPIPADRLGDDARAT